LQKRLTAAKARQSRVWNDTAPFLRKNEGTREERRAAADKLVNELEEQLSKVKANTAKAKALGARADQFLTGKSHMKEYGAAVAIAGLGMGGLIASTSLERMGRGPKEMSPSDPKFYWEKTVIPDASKVRQIQFALESWGRDYWPEGTEKTGTFGPTTRGAIRYWRERQGLNPDRPMTEKETEWLLSGGKGYISKTDKKWRRGDGSRAKFYEPEEPIPVEEVYQ
jgi:hypothetical protein